MGRRGSTGAALSIAVALAGCGGSGSSSSSSSASPSATSVPSIKAKVTTYHIGGDPFAVAVAGRFVWVANHNEGTVTRIAPASGKPSGTTRLGPDGTDTAALAVSDGSLWDGYSVNSGFATRLNTVDGAPQERLRAQGDVLTLAVGPDAVYAGSLDQVLRLPRSGGKPQSRTFPGRIFALAYTGGVLWVGSYDPVQQEGSLVGLDARTMRTRTRIVEQQAVLSLVVADGSLWESTGDGQTGYLLRRDPHGGQLLKSISAVGGPVAIAFAMGRVWVDDYYASTVYRVNPHTAQIEGAVHFAPARSSDDLPANTPVALAGSSDALWVTDRAGLIRRIAPG